MNFCLTRLRPSLAALVCVLAVGAQGCSIATERPVLTAPAQTPASTKESPYLKAHLKNGELCVFNSWQVVADGARIEGYGSRYTVQRDLAGQGQQSIPIDTIALVETNTPDKVSSAGAGALRALTVVMGSITGVCLANPKSCFGSCPTFYLDEAPDGRPEAEGFSESIARALEARDVDALFMARPAGRSFALTMRNEALETQAVKRARLLVSERPQGGRVIAGGDGRYYPATGFASPEKCQAPEGDCLASVIRHDTEERRSLADATDLATREDVDLVFAPTRGRVGLVIAARQTLLTTFLFYQTMAYLGRNAGDYLASMERGGKDTAAKAMGMARKLGSIDVSVAEGDGPWTDVGSFDEVGPIAGDVRVLPFEASGRAPIRVRLRQAKGHWRLGWVALARVADPVVPRAIEASAVTREGHADASALAQLRSGESHLVMMPGDAYRISFDLPGPGPELELFLETEGYYYEWMRQEWLPDEDPAMAALAFGWPEIALRRLAAPFKQREATLEQAFWASRFRKGDTR